MSRSAQGARRRVLEALPAWVEQGWLRRLDAAFVAFVAERGAHDDAQVLLAVAWLVHLEGLGHVCLPLQAPGDPGGGGGAQSRLSEQLLGLARELLQPQHGDLASAWLRALRGSEVVWWVQGGGDDGGQPLVLEHDRLYLRRYREYERRLAAQWLQRAGCQVPVAKQEVARWMDRLFEPVAAADAQPDWQRIACAIALRSRVSVITGGPGTGKTYTAARLLVLLLASAPQPLRVALAAPTGKAAARLQQSLEAALAGLARRLGEGEAVLRLAASIPAARTLHALLGAQAVTRGMRHHAGHLLDVDLLLVDEASMVHLEMMTALLEALPPHARLVLLGDRDQLASVEAGAVLGELCEHAAQGRYLPRTVQQVRELCGQEIDAALQDAQGPLVAQGVAMLRRSHRFGSAIGQLAQAVHDGDAGQALRALRAGEGLDGRVHEHPSQVCAIARGDPGLRACLEQARAGAPGDPAARDAWALRVLRAAESFRVLCAMRSGPWGAQSLNRDLELALHGPQVLGSAAQWYPGRLVMLSRNDPGLGLFNGDMGIALRQSDGVLRVAFAHADTVRWVAPVRLAHVEGALAMTVHKAQGSEFAHVVVVLGAGHGATRELLYTAITRARSRLSLSSCAPGVFEQVVGRRTQRGGGLSWRLRGACGGGQ